MMKTAFLTIILSLLFSITAIAKDGAYHQLGLVQNIMAGNDLDFVDDAFGPDIAIGYKFGSISVEGEWVLSEHQGNVGFADADFSGLSVNLLFPIVSKDDRGELYVLGGYGNYNFDLSNGNKLEGKGYNLGLGSDYYFNETVAQVIRLVYRFIDYDEANNPAVRMPLDGKTISVQIGIRHHF